MLGTIAGDIIGSVHEHDPAGSTDFPLFTPLSRVTDDTVLTVATAHALLTGTSCAEAYHEFGNRRPRAGYGGSFRRWLRSPDRRPYGSWGNDSAMRVSPVGLAAPDAAWALDEAARSAAATHDHPEGIKGAQAVALAVYLARTGESKETIRREVASHTGYDLSRTVEEIRLGYGFDVSCAGSVPEAIIALLDADDVEHAILFPISLGGDAAGTASSNRIARAWFRQPTARSWRTPGLPDDASVADREVHGARDAGVAARPVCVGELANRLPADRVVHVQPNLDRIS